MCKMFNKLLIVILFVFGNSRESFSQKFKKYDVLVLSQNWPQTACWSLNNMWPSSDGGCSPCKMPKSRTSWTLHGLWTLKFSGSDIVYCNNKYKFDHNLLDSSCKAQMIEKWMSFNLQASHHDLWGKQWKRHGTCTLDLESTNSLPKYFTKSIQMIDAHNVGELLRRSNITAGNTYKLAQIQQGLQSILGVHILALCSTNTVTHKQYLGEIHICFNKSFQLTDCPRPQTSCLNAEDIVYPKMLNSC